MIRFEEKKIVIEIETSFPADDWKELVTDLLRVIACMNKDFVNSDYDSLYRVCDLLCQMIPEEASLRKMIEKRGG